MEITYISKYKDLDKIDINVPNICNSHYGLILTTGLGYDLFKTRLIVNKPSQIQSVTITSDMLINEYRDLNIETISSLIVKSKPSDYFMDVLLKKYVSKSNKISNAIKYNNIELNITKYLIVRVIHKFDNEARYYYEDKNIEDAITPIDLTERYYFNIEDKGDYSKYNKSSEMSESIGFRMSYRITEMILGNKSEYIVFNINRRYNSQVITDGKILNINRFINIKIIPEEIITINTSQYKLSSIILFFNHHYVSIILINNEYYLYDDKFSPPIKDFLHKIGSYDCLNKFIYKGITNISLRNSTNLF